METDSTTAAQDHQKLFISYARRDLEWLERFKPYLTPAANSGALKVWWDKEGTPSGAYWEDTIKGELASATAALILVSDNLLASDFIRQTELPAIHERRRAGDLRMYWVPLSDVGNTNLRFLGLDQIQAAAPCDPNNPLDRLDDDRRKKAAVAAICDRILVDLKIVERLGRAGHMSEERRSDVVAKALERLSGVLDFTPGETVGYGDFAIVCRGRMDAREVAVKVLVESPFRERNVEFEERVKRARAVDDASFYKLRYCDMSEEPQLLVSDYIGAPTLAQHLAQLGRPIEPGMAARLIQRLVTALQEYHRCGLRYGSLTSQNLYYDEKVSPPGLIRLPAISISSHLSQSHEVQTWFPRDAVEATYMVPEQFEGQPYTEKSDQYAIGLIALEMLDGRPPVTVTRLAHLDMKRQFYDDPSRFAGAWQRDQSRLRGILFRMLEKDPSRRFENLAEITAAFAHLEPADAAQAKKSYSRNCAGNSQFYAEFYRRFFSPDHCPEARSMFGDLDDQYAKLDAALHYLLNFADQDMTEPTSLTMVARRHSRLRVSGVQFDHFATALLETLREWSREDEAVIDAWRRTIRPGVQYLKLRAAATPKTA